MLSTIKSAKLEKRNASDRARGERNVILREREAAKFDSTHREEKKRRYTNEGKAQVKRAKKKQRL
jgi:hypothetical protein